VTGRVLRFLTGLGLACGAVLLALYGLFALLYRGDSGSSGNTYVKLFGSEVDADVVGAVALVAALMLLLVSLPLVRRRQVIFKSVKTSPTSGAAITPLDRCDVECVDPQRVRHVLERLPAEGTFQDLAETFRVISIRGGCG
jgi:hypothetical protein